MVADALGILDDIGIKKSNVYWYQKDEGEEPFYSQVLPTPIIQDYSHNIRLLEGGAVQQGDLILTNIPKSIYNEESLETATEEGTREKYWVINGLAYTTVRIVRNYLSFNVQIRRYDANIVQCLLVSER